MMCEILDYCWVKKAVVFVSQTTCEQCNGFTRGAHVHNELFIIGILLKKFTCLILGLVFSSHG